MSSPTEAALKAIAEASSQIDADVLTTPKLNLTYTPMETASAATSSLISAASFLLKTASSLMLANVNYERLTLNIKPVRPTEFFQLPTKNKYDAGYDLHASVETTASW